MPTALPNPLLFDANELQSNPEEFCNKLNQFVSSVRDAQDTNSAKEQLDTISLFVGANPSPYPFSFRWRNTQAVPTFCVCGFVDTTDGVENVLTGIIPRWTYSEGRIIINGMRGTLNLNKTYTFVFLTKAP